MHTMDMTPRAALDALLSVFRNWHFQAHCSRCRVLGQVDVNRLLAQDSSRRVLRVVYRLRCSRCGELPASVTLADGHPGDGKAERRRIQILPEP